MSGTEELRRRLELTRLHERLAEINRLILQLEMALEPEPGPAAESRPYKSGRRRVRRK